MVLASDASHFYENMETGSPFPIVHDLAAMLQGYERLRELADSPQHVVPGHDPLVLDRYPRSVPDFDDSVRVDLAPIE